MLSIQFDPEHFLPRLEPLFNGNATFRNTHVPGYGFQQLRVCFASTWGGRHVDTKEAVGLFLHSRIGGAGVDPNSQCPSFASIWTAQIRLLQCKKMPGAIHARPVMDICVARPRLLPEEMLLPLFPAALTTSCPGLIGIVFLE